ncbi:hypothetical protein CLA01_37060 [Chryseobacterium lathyri]|uniref:Uncharacterized protein n=1 Tax=Chryseobacterium lathyri TaxID=395933 RepID=A0A511YEL2_9FLAO|nr:hypothetical protein CLA01_37060 [Chryseobacterium lathyri]
MWSDFEIKIRNQAAGNETELNNYKWVTKHDTFETLRILLKAKLILMVQKYSVF